MQIISRTVSILEEVARRPDGGGLVEIANATSLPAATCHRLLAALAEDELVHRDPLTRRYSVGRGLVQLAGMVTQIGRGASIEAGMTALRDRWRECFFLASVVDDAIICVRSLPTIDPNRMTVTVPLGQPMAPNVAGSAKAILAHVSAAERERLIPAGGGMARLTDKSIVDAIQGHAPKTVGDDYGEYPPDAMDAEISKHPQYEVVAPKRMDRRRSGQ